jgi:hypothetical protein
LAVGVALAAGATLTSHHYDDPSRRVADFLLGDATLGPAGAATLAIGHSLARLTLTSPLGAIVDHPYSDVRSAYSSSRVRVESFRAVRGLDGAIIFAPASAGRFGLIYAYRLSLLDYADVQPVRTTTHSFSIGIVHRALPAR